MLPKKPGKRGERHCVPSMPLRFVVKLIGKRTHTRHVELGLFQLGPRFNQLLGKLFL